MLLTGPEAIYTHFNISNGYFNSTYLMTPTPDSETVERLHLSMPRRLSYTSLDALCILAYNQDTRWLVHSCSFCCPNIRYVFDLSRFLLAHVISLTQFAKRSTPAANLLARTRFVRLHVHENREKSARLSSWVLERTMTVWDHTMVAAAGSAPGNTCADKPEECLPALDSPDEPVSKTKTFC